jgi:endoglucanase
MAGSLFTYTGPSEGDPWDEIDIEFLGKDTTKMQTNYFTNGVGGHETLIDLGFDGAAGFHDYAFEWTEAAIRWYVDGNLVHTETGSRGPLPTHPGKIMVNLWPGTGVDGWLGPFSYSSPLTAQYDALRYTTTTGLGTQLITNRDFTSDMTAWSGYGGSYSVNAGVLEAVRGPANPNPNVYDAAATQDFGVLGHPLAAGIVHTLSFDAWASTPATIKAVVQNRTIYTQHLNVDPALTTTPTHFSYTFTPASSDADAQVAFQIGQMLEGTTFHVDNVSLTHADVPPPSTAPSRTGELVKNGFFKNGTAAPWWETSSVSSLVSQGRLEATITNGGSNPWDAIVGQSGLPVFAGSSYTLTLKAWASVATSTRLVFQQDGPPYAGYFVTTLPLSTVPKTFTFTFTGSVNDPAATLQFQMGGQGEHTVYLDNLSLYGPQPVGSIPAGQLLSNGTFNTSLAPWWTAGSVDGSVSGGAAQVVVDAGGSNPWDAILGQSGVPILKDGQYTLSFDAAASTPVSVVVLIQKDGPPYTGYFRNGALSLTTAMSHYSYSFTAPFDDPAATLQFQIGGVGAFTMTVDNVSLQGPKPVPFVPLLTAVRTNQVGFLPRAPKRATIAIEATSPQPWTLFDSYETPVATGTTRVIGPDAASGEFLHTADFSRVTAPGQGYVLEVYGERSYPFAIGNDTYQQLKYDALHYFYHNRSGIEVAQPFAGGDEWTRPAGHIGVPPNQGDLAVPCFSGVDNWGATWTGCSYTLNVTKGWYDAGDHGKYVVNGGLATWVLLNEFARSRHVVGSDRRGLGDGTLNIPENGNGVPDILDEARWELEFLLSMQVPPGGVVEGVPLAGMVHHKVHDRNWTGLGLLPSDDPQPRLLYPPSTAATLNLAAVGAQCARIWKRLDPAFSGRCLTAAETAWQAALAHPRMIASDRFLGGGGYADGDVSDEFYWAASELFITTAKVAYKNYLVRSPHFLSVPADIDAATGIARGSSLGWQRTQALGTLSLALVPNSLGIVNVLRARVNVLRAADGYAAAYRHEPYGLPYSSASGYAWGSNSEVLNNALVLGLAYDFSPKPEYLQAISAALDYLLGRNPNVKSYVSGYGERPIQNPHHRFWAHSLNPALPGPAPGALAGGPNQHLDDPFAQALFASDGCAPQTCYVDNIQSYSTNEVAINWNAVLAWAAARLDDPRLKQTGP